MKAQSNYSINIGSTSLVMIFAVLCLTVFATMSYLTAVREANLAKKYAQHTTAYYAADSRAVEKLNFVNSALSSAQAHSGNEEQRKAFIAAQCSPLNIQQKTQNGHFYLFYDETIDAAQSIQVIIQVDFYPATVYRVIQWKSVYTQDYNIDQSLNVYQ